MSEFRDLPPALRAIDQEEPVWHMLYFIDEGSKHNTLSVRRTGYGNNEEYEFKILRGHSDPENLAPLDDIKPRYISREHALELRERFEPQWSKRPQIAELASFCVTQGFLEEEPDGSLSGFADLEGAKQADSFSIKIKTDGAISVSIDKPNWQAYVDGKPRDVRSHEYRLLRGVPFAEHDIYFIDSKIKPHLPRTIYNAGMIATQCVQWFEVAFTYSHQRLMQKSS